VSSRAQRGALARIEGHLNHLGLRLMTWQAGAILLVALAAVVWLAALVVGPGQGTEQTVIFGTHDFGGFCEWRRDHGYGCLNCGMTRSWVHGARGHVLTAFAYSAPGAAMFFGITVGGLLSAVRLVARRRLIRVPWPVTMGLVAAWVLIWLGLFALRSQGILPVP